MSSQGKVALFTGANRGIGRAIALRLAKEGAAVVANSAERQRQAQEVVARVEKASGRALAVQAERTRPRRSSIASWRST